VSVDISRGRRSPGGPAPSAEPVQPSWMPRPLDGPTLRAYLGDLPRGAHGAIIYNEDRIRTPLEFAFLRAGLERGECAVFACADRTPGQIAGLMREHGLDPGRYGEALSIRTATSLLGDVGHPELAHWKRSLDEVRTAAREMGRPHVRWSGELSNFYLLRGRLDTWFELEDAVEATGSDSTLLCAYDARITYDTSVVDLEQHYKEIPLDRSGSPVRHSFVVVSLSADAHRLMEARSHPPGPSLDE
jgi:MEDS: MEthanogen/methylotroph, DcmR Sensory domain